MANQRVKCPKCGRVNHINPTKNLGSTVRCTRCKEILRDVQRGRRGTPPRNNVVISPKKQKGRSNDIQIFLSTPHIVSDDLKTENTGIVGDEVVMHPDLAKELIKDATD